MRRGLVCVLLLLQILPLSGCWNYSELDDRAIIAGAAIDRMESGEIRLTVETVAFHEGQSTGPKSELLSGVGGSVPEAIFHIMNQSQKELYWHHAALLVLGESYAAEGIGDLLDYILKEHEMRLTLTLAVSRLETAAEVLGLECHGAEIRSFGIAGIIEEQDRQGQTVRADAYRVLDTRLGGERDLVLPQIGSVRQGKKNAVNVSGCGVFSGDHLAGWLPAEETRFLRLFGAGLDEVEVDLMTQEGPVSLRVRDWTVRERRSADGETGILETKAEYELLSGKSRIREAVIAAAMDYYVNQNLSALRHDLHEMQAKLLDWEDGGAWLVDIRLRRRAAQD
ncbi:MAG: hypothetical protein E7458_09220 [Ruminococcaceae bacterium]|nr:hypothetical protein [Oscillospiraceae bacterium]